MTARDRTLHRMERLLAAAASAGLAACSDVPKPEMPSPMPDMIHPHGHVGVDPVPPPQICAEPEARVRASWVDVGGKRVARVILEGSEPDTEVRLLEDTPFPNERIVDRVMRARTGEVVEKGASSSRVSFVSFAPRGAPAFVFMAMCHGRQRLFRAALPSLDDGPNRPANEIIEVVVTESPVP